MLTELRLATNKALIQSLNERVAVISETLETFGPLKFMCECGIYACKERIELTVTEYEAFGSIRRTSSFTPIMFSTHWSSSYSTPKAMPSLSEESLQRRGPLPASPRNARASADGRLNVGFPFARSAHERRAYLGWKQRCLHSHSATERRHPQAPAVDQGQLESVHRVGVAETGEDAAARVAQRMRGVPATQTVTSTHPVRDDSQAPWADWLIAFSAEAHHSGRASGAAPG